MALDVDGCKIRLTTPPQRLGLQVDKLWRAVVLKWSLEMPFEVTVHFTERA